MKELTGAQKIAKEDHDLGECGTGCTWCYKDRLEFINALIQPTPGYVRSGNTFKG